MPWCERLARHESAPSPWASFHSAVIIARRRWHIPGVMCCGGIRPRPKSRRVPPTAMRGATRTLSWRGPAPLEWRDASRKEIHVVILTFPCLGLPRAAGPRRDLNAHTRRGRYDSCSHRDGPRRHPHLAQTIHSYLATIQRVDLRDGPR